MAIKTDFEATNDVASPFVDEVANPGVYGDARERGRKARKDKRKSDAQDRKRRRKQGF